MMSDQINQDWSAVLNPPPSGISGLHGIAIWLYTGSLLAVFFIGMLRLVCGKVDKIKRSRGIDWKARIRADIERVVAEKAIKPVPMSDVQPVKRTPTQRERAWWWFKGWKRLRHEGKGPMTVRAWDGYHHAARRLDHSWRQDIPMKTDAPRFNAKPREERSVAA